MNNFYDIAPENSELQNDFQLRNLGLKTEIATIGTSVRFGWEREYQSKTYYRDTNAEDYDKMFSSKLLNHKPTYDLTKVLDYHLDFYLAKKKGDKDIFLKHIKYIILPDIKKAKNSEVVQELVETWIKQMTPKKGKSTTNIKVGQIKAPTQILVNSDNSVQRQNITYDSGDIKELLRKLTIDVQRLESDLREDLKDEIEKTLKQLNRNKDVTGRLLTIGEMIKDIGIGVFTNLVSSPTFELLKPLMGLG